MIENPDCSWLWRQKEMKKFRVSFCLLQVWYGMAEEHQDGK